MCQILVFLSPSCPRSSVRVKPRLNRVLNNREGRRVAFIFNDMSEMNILLHSSPPIEGTGEIRLVLVLDPVFDPDEAE